MKLSKSLKNGSLAAALGLGLSVFAIPAGNEAFAADNTKAQSQKLINSLQSLGVSQVDYLYSYLQSVNLSNAEVNGILANTKRVSDILKNSNPANLPQAQKVEVARLFLDSVKLSHLKAAIVDDQGRSIDPTNYKPGTTGLKIQLMDLKGNLLATIDPKKSDLDPRVIQSKLISLKQAVLAKEALEKTGKFVPMAEAKLPKTATNNYDYMAIGGLIMLLGGLTLVPAARFYRKSGQSAEA